MQERAILQGFFEREGEPSTHAPYPAAVLHGLGRLLGSCTGSSNRPLARLRGGSIHHVRGIPSCFALSIYQSACEYDRAISWRPRAMRTCLMVFALVVGAGSAAAQDDLIAKG